MKDNSNTVTGMLFIQFEAAAWSSLMCPKTDTTNQIDKGIRHIAVTLCHHQWFVPVFAALGLLGKLILISQPFGAHMPMWKCSAKLKIRVRHNLFCKQLEDRVPNQCPKASVGHHLIDGSRRRPSSQQNDFCRQRP